MKHAIRFEANEEPPKLLSIGLALQLVSLTITGIVSTPTVIVKAAGASQEYMEYAVFV